MKRRNLRSLERRKGRKRLRALLLPLVLVLGLAAGGVLLIRQGVVVREIVFIGNHHLKNEELKTLVKLRPGDGLFDLSGKDLSRHLTASPWIREALVRKELSGRLLVKVTERVPVAILSLGGTPYLIDKDGARLEQIREGSPLLLPVIAGIDPAANGETYQEAVRLMAVLRARDVTAHEGALEISGERPDDLTLTLDGVVVKVGRGEFERKLERLEFVKEEIRKRDMQVELIDLRFANKIVVKPVGRKDEPASGKQREKTREQGHGKAKKR